MNKNPTVKGVIIKTITIFTRFLNKLKFLNLKFKGDL